MLENIKLLRGLPPELDFSHVFKRRIQLNIRSAEASGTV